MDFKNQKSHDSWVMTQFSRIDGGNPRLFGTSVKSPHRIVLRISPAKVSHDLGSDWYYSNPVPLIEVEFSQTQFAELLTTMNHGSGVPSTLRYVNGKQVPFLEETETLTDRIEQSFEESSDEDTVAIEDGIKHAQGILQQKTLTKENRNFLSGLFDKLKYRSKGNARFYMKQFQEGMDRVKAEAKAEIDATVQHAIVTTGLQALKNLQLTDKSE